MSESRKALREYEAALCERDILWMAAERFSVASGVSTTMRAIPWKLFDLMMNATERVNKARTVALGWAL